MLSPLNCRRKQHFWSQSFLKRGVVVYRDITVDWPALDTFCQFVHGWNWTVAGHSSKYDNLQFCTVPLECLREKKFKMKRRHMKGCGSITSSSWHKQWSSTTDSPSLAWARLMNRYTYSKIVKKDHIVRNGQKRVDAPYFQNKLCTKRWIKTTTPCHYRYSFPISGL